MSQTVTLLVERKLSDGNYGSQGFSLGSTLTFEDHEHVDYELVKAQHDTLLAMVLERLAASPNGRIAFTAQRELHREEDEARADAWANSNAASEERAIRVLDSEGELEELPF
jgi:hypothetical protein